MRERRETSRSRPEDTRARGRAGEDLEARHLEAQGVRILARNVHLRHAEIDIVALDGDTLLFVEVRLRSSTAFGGAAASVGRNKQLRIARAAAELLATRRLPRHRRVRLDVIAIDASQDPPVVDHIEDAFRADGT